ncbi:MAG: EutN/CcmL family microcompartment protein [Acidobacteria bacterium]|nr:EutN/CcmL family microcompartment protein [Acidobacteriota bacterium]
MLLGHIVGTVVATRKDPRLEGRKLLVVAPFDAADPSGKKGSAVIAVDTVGAGVRETVLVVQGSSARMAQGCNECPVDAAIVGIVDTVDIDGAGG